MKSEDTAKRVVHPCKHHRNGNTVGKRSFRRAQQRALREGKALYRGRWYKASQFCLPTQLHTNTTKRRQPLLCIQNPGEHRRAGRYSVFSWNSGGLSTGQLDELYSWADTQAYDIVFIQETRWRQETTWETNSFLCMHCGETKQGNSWCGILVMISKRVTSSALIRWATIVPGRVMHVRFQDRFGSFDLVNCYQVPFSERVDKQRSREEVWHRLSQVLHQLPLRNRFLMAGDFNMSLSPRAPWIGTAVRKCSVESSKPDVLGDLAEVYNLCSLNSWAGHDEITCATVHGGGSCIDSIWTRLEQADPLARQMGVVKSCPLLACQSACIHYPLTGTIPKLWKCWDRTPKPKSSQSRIDIEALCDSARVKNSAWTSLVARIQEALPSYTVMQMDALTTKVCQLCCEMFPVHLSQRQDHHQDSGLRGLRHEKWQLWREIQRPCGCSIHSVFLRWWVVIRIKALSRDSAKRSRRLRRERLDRVYADATVAASRNNIRTLFRHIRRLAPKKSRIRMSLRDSSGSLLGPIEEGKCLYNYFRQVFQDDDAPMLAPVLCDSMPFTQAHLGHCIGALPAHKSVPRHCVPSAVWKYLAPEITPWLYSHLNRFWNNAIPQIPLEWKASWLVLVPKPGKNGTAVEHWRPISLQEALGKATLRTITQRAQEEILPLLTCWPQYAYLPGRGTYDAIAKVLLHCEEVRLTMKAHRHTIHDRRAGLTRTECVGGLQILIDLKGAFDRAPRWLLQQALLDLPLPPPLLSLLLAWHGLTPYHIEHAGHQHTIDGNVGVRQGCVAAPLLWVAFKRYWKKHLAQILSYSWVRSHLTVYADDNHIAWRLCDASDVHTAIKEAVLVLKSFAVYGMTLNLDKTVCIFAIRGRLAKGLRRRYVVSHKGLPHLRLEQDLLLPLVNSHVYLGIKVSYGLVARQTLLHRKQAARRTFMTLRVWWVPSRLPLNKRIQLWKTCVWPSLCYALVETGLGAPQCLVFRRTVYRDLRWIARSHSYYTGESNDALLCRLGMIDPLLVLAKATIQHWTKKWTQSSHLSSEDVLQDRWQLLMTQFVGQHCVLLWIQFCFDLVRVFDTKHRSEDSVLWKTLSALGLDEMRRAYDMILHPLPEPELDLAQEQYRCDLCEKTFPTSRGLRVHENKVHGTQSPGWKLVQNADFRSSGLGGMPICERCKQKFADWFSFDRHVLRGVCKAHTLTSTSTSVISVMPSTSRTPEQRTAEKPLIQQHDVLKHLATTWQSLLNQRIGFRQSLKHHCCICNQWFEKGWHLTHHGSRKHPLLFQQGRQHRNQFMLENGIAPIKWECPYCIAVFQSPNIHYCPVLLQISVLVRASGSCHGIGNGVGGEGQPRNDDIPRPAQPPARQRTVLRRGPGNRGQEASRSTAAVRRRIRVKSRPPGSTVSLRQGQADAGHVTCIDQVSHPPRRSYQHLADGEWIHDVHEHSGSRNCALASSSSRKVEGCPSETAIGCLQSSEAHPLQELDRRTSSSSPVALQRGCCLTKGSGGGDEVRDLRCRGELQVSSLEWRERGVRGHRTGSAAQRSRSCRSPGAEHLASPHHDPQIPLHQTTDIQYVGEDRALHARDWMEELRIKPRVEHLGQDVSLRNHGSDWSKSAPHHVAEVSSCDGAQEIARQDEQVTSAMASSSSSCMRVLSSALLPSMSMSQFSSSVDREQPVLDEWLRMRLTNPSLTVCYLNAGFSALGWAILNHDDSLDTWEDLGIWIHELRSHTSPHLVYAVAMGRQLMNDWPDLLRQHDVAEILGYLLQKLVHRRPTLGRWGAQQEHSRGLSYTEPLVQPLPIHLPTGHANCSLQYLIDTWTVDDTGMRLGLIAPAPAFLFVQLVRFSVISAGNIRKNRCVVSGLEDPVRLPILRDESAIQMELYNVHSVILHLGESPLSGHYVVYLRSGDQWWKKDDARMPQTYTSLTAEQACDGYVLCLRRVTQAGASAGSSPT